VLLFCFTSHYGSSYYPNAYKGQPNGCLLNPHMEHSPCQSNSCSYPAKFPALYGTRRITTVITRAFCFSIFRRVNAASSLPAGVAQSV
jgi:hypothetical protein